MALGAWLCFSVTPHTDPVYCSYAWPKHPVTIDRWRFPLYATGAFTTHRGLVFEDDGRIPLHDLQVNSTHVCICVYGVTAHANADTIVSQNAAYLPSLIKSLAEASKVNAQATKNVINAAIAKGFNPPAIGAVWTYTSRTSGNLHVTSSVPMKGIVAMHKRLMEHALLSTDNHHTIMRVNYSHTLF